MAARKIASGDLDTRLYKNSDDELGELCDTINYMADELSATENMKNDLFRRCLMSFAHRLRQSKAGVKRWRLPAVRIPK